ncbi:hypothetical protein CDAR_215151 [Caerostris darwini]|uniref:Uncharacterized protein n=1 Tax=Caerostris darwini TaxID=1538125 RepID=A0AAV4QR18_9ARAC|nr:hypothetical protein CDAR_215151 [Caerostris darwini]
MSNYSRSLINSKRFNKQPSIQPQSESKSRSTKYASNKNVVKSTYAKKIISHIRAYTNKKYMALLKNLRLMQEGSTNNHALEKNVLDKFDWPHEDFMMAQKVHGSMLLKLRRILGDEEHCLHRALRFLMDTHQLYHVAEKMEIAENKELYKETEKRLFKQFQRNDRRGIRESDQS